MKDRFLALFCLLMLAAVLGRAARLHAADPSLESGAEAFQRGAVEEAAARWANAE